MQPRPAGYLLDAVHTASFRAVLPVEEMAQLTLAPQAISVSIISLLSLSAAMCRGVMLDPLWALTWAPFCARMDRTRWVPYMVARCSGQCLRPLSTCTFTWAPCAHRVRRQRMASLWMAVSIIWILSLGFVCVVEVMGQFSSIRCRVVRPSVSLE